MILNIEKLFKIPGFLVIFVQNSGFFTISQIQGLSKIPGIWQPWKI